MTHNQRIGKWGEQAATDFLIERGYEIVARNVRTPYGEIDLIAKKGGYLIFVEVKARMTNTFGPPEVSVTPRKQQHMLACAEYYTQQNEIDHWQIDVIAVEQDEGKPKITHVENAIS
jgi:putative endonuclease